MVNVYCSQIGMQMIEYFYVLRNLHIYSMLVALFILLFIFYCSMSEQSQSLWSMLTVHRYADDRAF